MINIGQDYQIQDELWKKIEPLLPPPKPKKKSGRPREDDRKMMNAIYYILRTGCQWKALPRVLGAPSTVHDRFKEWCEAGLFEKLWKEGLLEYDKKKNRLGVAIDGWSYDFGRRRNRAEPDRSR